MRKLDFLKGKDAIIGRPIRLNRKRLEIKNGKKYAEVVFCGDWHLGAREFDRERLKRMLDYCLEKEVYIFLMGDLLESGLRTSVGASVYRQTLNPQQQMEEIVELLTPLVQKGLVIGSLEGNHELRIEQHAGISIMKVICKLLKISYLRSACWNIFYVGNQSYTAYTLHGSSGSRFVYTKLKALVDISHSFNADILVMAHVHELADTSQQVQEVDRNRKMVIEKKKFLLLTGSYLKYQDSYVQERGFPIAKLGSPKVKFFSEKHDLHISY